MNAHQPDHICAFWQGSGLFFARLAGNEVTDWYTIYGVSSDQTVGELFAQAQVDAQARVETGVNTPPVLSLSSINQVILEQV